MTRKRENWLAERLGQAIVLGIVGYYATFYVTDLKSLAILVIVGFVLVGWELDKISNALNVQSEAWKTDVASLESDVGSLESETREITALLQDMSAALQRAEAEHTNQQRQISELLQLTEAVLAHQPPNRQF